MNVIIFRDEGDTDRKSFEDALAKLFAERAAAAVLLLPHIYHIAEHDGVWDELAAIGEAVVCLSSLHPRPAEWLLKRHGIGRAGLTAFDMRAYESPEQCVAACGEHPPGEAGAIAECAAETATRWHPVIDRGRCVNCKQCMRFCLFGVYEFDAQFAVRVANPDNCKPGCPACARICPSSAIMFPLYEKDEAIAGAPGKFVSPDAAAKKMFERRTQQPYQQADAASDDGLDELIDDLDRLTEGGTD